MNDEYSELLAKIDESIHAALPGRIDSAWLTRVAGEGGLPVSQESVDRINAPNLELLHRGGKRWRPLVMALTYELEGGVGALGHKLAPLVELPHNGSLIVDDIEDRSDERRGGPAIHLLYGVDVSINSGNFLYFLPTYLLDQADLPVDRKYEIQKYFLRVMRRLHLGQGLDIQWHNDHHFVPEVEAYLQMCRFKTGSLSRLAAEIGAAAAGASRSSIEALGAIWENIGVGFQIMDDVRNLATGNPGKRRGDDIIEGKKSLPVILHCRSAADGGRGLLEIFTRITELGQQEQGLLILEAIGIMEASGAIDEARILADRLLAEARRRLAVVYPLSSRRSLIERMIEGFLESLKVG